jgi:hypothetical protein
VDANLVVTGFTSFQPPTISRLARPTSITYSLQNFGPGSLGNLSGGTGPVTVELWLSSNTSYGDGDDRYLGTMQFSISAPAGSSGTYTHSNVNGLSGFTIPADASGNYYVFVRVVPAPASGLTDPTWNNNYGMLSGTVTVLGSETTRPTVDSIIRWNPPFQTNNAQFVTWLVNFSEPVMGIDLSDFTLVDVDGSVLGEFLGNVSSGGGSQVQVTANTGGGGVGDLRLDVIYPGATLADLAGNALTNSFSTGQIFTVDKVPSTVVSINRYNPANQTTSANSVVWRVTFSESVNNVSTDDFTLVDVSSSITGESITSVSASSGTSIDVTVSTGSSGDGTLRLDVLAGVATITDAVGNSLNQNFTSGEAYSIVRTAPVANSLSPADGAVGVALDTALVITFSEPALKGAGNIVIRKSSDDLVVETIAVTSAQVTVVGDLATIDPSSPLTSDTGYYVQIDSGAFEDLAGNDYAGISDKTGWNFLTADTMPPQLTAWQSVSIPDLPAGSRLGAVWARTRNEAYVWASLTNSPQSFLFRWDGAMWEQVLSLTNHYPGKIFGTGSSDVFVSADFYTNASGGNSFARVYRSTDNGTNWTQQVLPSAISNEYLNFGYFGGTPNNVHFHSGASASYITRFDGTNWNLVFTANYRGIYGLTLASTNEGYYVTCSGWGSWNGTNWLYRGTASIGCDVYGGVWGMRGASGALGMFATGQTSNNKGPRIWSFNEPNQTWSQVFADGPGTAGSGNGIAVWGSAPNDVYVVGELISGQTHTGKVYHYDGAAWMQITNIGVIPRPGGIGGTADDVWISLGTDGAMLHFAPASPPVLSITPVTANVLLSWPGPAVGFRLESAVSLLTPINWSSGTNIPILISNTHQVTLSVTNESEFFRLVNP